jgi:eukaryotic-like serine/threonine-protein kinase
MRCLSPQELEDLSRGRLTGEARLAAEAHIASCPECGQRVAGRVRRHRSDDAGPLAVAQTEVQDPAKARTALSATLSPYDDEEEASAARPPPRSVGRYQLEGELGAGGMGVVYGAHDPELDRRVAIKLLRPSTFADAEEQRARLRHEAQAMAKLSHPNVVAVYDVGSVGDQIFLAAELVDGTTLSRWLTESARPRREVLRLFIEAGQGLEAAHAAGIVHRDFKPDNVLIGRDGRARVTDFGLARAARPSGDDPRLAAGVLQCGTMTRTGALAGTPPYMAPELWQGGRADALSDQFAFTVALHEGVVGEQPFVGRSLPELAQAICSGAARPLPRGTPAWLRRLIGRGLKVAPAQRYPSMTELLSELRRDRRRLLRVGVWASGALGVAAALVLASGVLQPRLSAPRLPSTPPPGARQSPARSCSIGGAEQAWNEERRSAVAQAFARHVPRSLGQRVSVALQDYARRFSRARELVCSRDPPATSSAARCLDRRRQALSGLVAALTPTRARLRLARELVDRLAAPETCVRSDGAAPVRPPRGAAGQVALLEGDLWAARTELQLGETLKAKEELARLLPAAQALGHAPLVAEAQLVDGLVSWARGELSVAERKLTLAAGTARACDEQEVAWEAALALVDVAGAELVQPSERWVRQAGELRPRDDPAAAQRLATATARALRASGYLLKAQELLGQQAGGAPAGQIALQVSASTTALVLEDQPRALKAALAAVSAAERAWDPEDPGWAEVEQAHARALVAAGQVDKALEHARRAESLAFDAGGLGSEVVARSYDETGAILESLGRFAAAREKYARALSTRTLVRDDNPAQWRSQLLLGSVLVREGRAREGVQVLARTVGRLSSLYRAHDTALVDPLHRLARAQAAAGQLAASQRSLTRAIAIVEARHGPVSPLLGSLRISQGQARLAAGDRKAALASFDAAHQSLQAGYGLGHPQVDRNVRQRAELALALGDVAYARRLAGTLK